MQRLANGSVYIVDSPVFFEIVLLLIAGAFGAGAWLQLQHVPPKYFIASALVAGALMCVASALQQQKRTFLFDPSAQKFTWGTRGLLKSSEGALPFSDITDVRLEKFSDGRGATYRVALVTPTGVMPLSNAYDANEKKVAQQAASIIELIGRDPTKPIQVVDSSPWTAKAKP